ncbi:hypothetical protein FI615_002770, partial [Enterococcus faecium]|nr:hypothetical protein [Enterococcus faecium]
YGGRGGDGGDGGDGGRGGDGRGGDGFDTGGYGYGGDGGIGGDGGYDGESGYGYSGHGDGSSGGSINFDGSSFKQSMYCPLAIKQVSRTVNLDETYGQNEMQQNILLRDPDSGTRVTNTQNVSITATNQNDQSVGLNDLTKKVGVYTITYSYGRETVDETVTVVEKISIELNEATTTKVLGNVYGENELRANIKKLTNIAGNDVLAQDRGKVTITAKDQANQPVALDDLTKKVGNYTITYSYNGKSVTESLKVVAWSIDLKGIYDQLFAQLIDNGDHTATLHEYAVKPHNGFNLYSSIQVTDQTGKTLFNKEYNGKEQLVQKDERISLPEGALLQIYHAEGSDQRYVTSNDTELKQHPGTNYNYVVRNGTLVQLTTDQTKIELNEVTTTKVLGNVYGENELRANIKKLTNIAGYDVLAQDRGKVTITAKDQANQPVALDDLTKKAGNYTITYSYNGKSVTEALKVVAWSIDLKGVYDR